MFPQTLITLFLLATYGSAAPSSPGPPGEMGSKHNLYLSTCYPQTGASSTADTPVASGPRWPCRWRFCGGQPGYGPGTPNPGIPANGSIVAYYATAPASSGSPPTIPAPAAFQVLAAPAKTWDVISAAGTIKWGTSTVSFNIAPGAEDAKKGDLAGTAKLDAESFACFRDGETEFALQGNGVGGGGVRRVCGAEFWCGSISV